MKKANTIARAIGALKKPFIIMKLSLLIIISCTFQTFAGANAQTVSLSATNVKISQVLSDIERQGNFRFLFNSRLKDFKQKVTVNFNDAEISDALRTLFKGTSLDYRKLENNLIAIRSTTDANQDIIISGRVVNEKGEGVTGASVLQKGTSNGTYTDANGSFTLTVPDNATLIITGVGYLPASIAVNGKQQITVTLILSNSKMDEVVVVGYGSQRKLDVTGSVGTIDGKEISKQSSINPISSLQGKVAGVQITNSGAPGASPTIKIRGVGSVYGSENPLYVVDGVWYNDVSFLNPADIENISILKDASSEAIYGVRAANGVVLITTKKGKGKPRINYNGYVGVQQVTHQVQMANGTQYAELINEMNTINGNPAPFANTSSFGTGTNWFDVVLRPALVTNHYLSVGGGAERSTYNLSVGYLKQEGIITGNDYDRITARIQNELQATDAIKIGINSIFEGSNSHDAPGGVIYKAYTAAPIVPVYYADGTYGDPADYPIGSAVNNPKVQLDFFNQKSKTYRLTGNIFGEVKLFRGLTFRSSFGGEFGQGEVRYYNPVYSKSQGNSIQFNLISKLRMERAETRNWIVENTLTYDKNIGDHRFKFLAGQTAQRYKFYKLTGTADNVPYTNESDLYLALGSNSASNPSTITDQGDLATYNSYFGRVNYSYMNKYLLTGSLRADGSSKFIGSQTWGYFPSVGAGWVISKESFMQSQKLFDLLKLRGSWGVVGNASVPANLSLLTVNGGAGFTAIFGQPGTPFPGASITTSVPPIIYWEKGIGTDVGLEATMLNNHLNVEIDWYERKTQNAIFDIPILGSVGLTTPTIKGNQADFRNRGLEFSAGYRNSINKDFDYSINGNFSINDNKVLRVATGLNPIYSGAAAATGGQFSTRTIAGQAIGQFYGLQVAGIFQDAAEVTASGLSGVKPGDFRYVDQNGDKVIDAKDRVVLGNPTPKYNYGVNTNFNYKMFDLTLDFQGVSGVKIYNANKGLRFGSENFSKDFYDNRWHGAGTSNSYPSANIGGGNNYVPNSWFVEDGSYFRVRNIQLGYTLPGSMVNRWKMDKVRFYVNAQNALNFFKYTGFTPEVGGGPTNAGIDNGIYPLSATYNFGVNVSF
ncbi:MAG: TonB-dependent receptor [Ferruginibacter sp.]